MEALAERLVEIAGVAPGSAATTIADRLGHRVEIRDNLPAGARGLSDGTKRLFVEPCDYRPRFELNVGHELGHYYMPWLRHSDEAEGWCQRFGAALLAPATWMLAQLARHGPDLAAIRRSSEHASWEALGNRVVDLNRDAALSKWVGRSCSYRRGRGGEPAAMVLRAERAVVALAMAGDGFAELALDGHVIRAWRLPGVRPRRAVALTMAA